MSEKRIVIVTGAAGFIGSHICTQLIKEGFYVKGIDNLSCGDENNVKHLKKNFELIVMDINNYDEIESQFYQAEYVVHLAAVASVPRSVECPLETHNSNVTGTLNVFQASRYHKVKRVVYASSSAVYGDSPKLPKRETMPLDPVSPYGFHKMSNEYYSKLYFNLYGLDSVGLRFFNCFGARQNPDSEYSAVIPKFIKKAKLGEKITIFGDGKTTRDFTYIENVTDAILLTLKSHKAIGGQVFNIANGQRYSLNELVSTIGKNLKRKQKPCYLPFRKGDIKHSVADISKAKKVLGYKPKIDFKEGIRRMCQIL